MLRTPRDNPDLRGGRFFGFPGLRPTESRPRGVPRRVEDQREALGARRETIPMAAAIQKITLYPRATSLSTSSC